MKVSSLKIDGHDAGLELTPRQFGDGRGWFSEVYNQRTFADAGIDLQFVQDNQSFSAEVGTVRGLHFQIAPYAQAKLVRVVSGAVLDVAVDIRKGSPTFGRHFSVVVSAEAFNQVLVPVGFAHGFCTLEPDTMLLYKVSAPYSREHDLGLLWSDPDLAIDWPTSPSEAVLSDKDMEQPRLKDLPDYFEYDALTDHT